MKYFFRSKINIRNHFHALTCTLTKCRRCVFSANLRKKLFFDISQPNCEFRQEKAIVDDEKIAGMREGERENFTTTNADTFQKFSLFHHLVVATKSRRCSSKLAVIEQWDFFIKITTQQPVLTAKYTPRNFRATLISISVVFSIWFVTHSRALLQRCRPSITFKSESIFYLRFRMHSSDERIYKQ